jgi:integrase
MGVDGSAGSYALSTRPSRQPPSVKVLSQKIGPTLAERRAAGRRRPTIEKRTVTPHRATNAAVRPRKYLTPAEVERLMRTATGRGGRHGHRDATMILLAYRHGLRASELCSVLSRPTIP